MKVIDTILPGLKIIEPTVFEDERGYFFESYNKEVFDKQGLAYTFVQDNQSKSSYGVIRGLHYQTAPYAQTKLVRVIEGMIYDVAVDIRKNSPTFGKWFGCELSMENKLQLLIPHGFAHGFSVLSKTAVVLYKCDSLYNKHAERGIRYDSPELAIDWKIPVEKIIVSDKDKLFPGLNSLL
ncbi:MAG: dTDP-4-dehydrorhamnose 3,5-epimerase [Bacteroidia bacterium]|nr:dTDP-4-dehydrorhamnose 3,5-epimerase [Bacteroidia bacterium]